MFEGTEYVIEKVAKMSKNEWEKKDNLAGIISPTLYAEDLYANT